MIPDLKVTAIASSCCGMAGSFGYEARHYDASMDMGEMGLLPTVREADPDTWIVADGASCRKQVLDGTGTLPARDAAELGVGAGAFEVRWDRRSDMGKSVARGMYVLRLTTGDETSGRKLLLLHD